MDKNTILLLSVVTAPATVLTQSQLLGVLELSGVVRNPDALRAMKFAASQPSASAPATLLGFVGTLHNLAKLHPEYTSADAEKLRTFVSKYTSTTADAPLTYGTLLPILNSLPNGRSSRKTPESAQPAAAARRRRRRG
jgi:hypothetical protein